MFAAIFLMIAVALPVAAESVDGFHCGPGHTYACDKWEGPQPTVNVVGFNNPPDYNIHGTSGQYIKSW